MTTEFRSFKEALRKDPLLGVCSMYPAPGILERIAADWDWCWIDLQHGQWGSETVIQAVRACNLADRFALVRVPGKEAGVIGKILDTGCHAVMAPMIESGADAAAIARAAAFKPRGGRSFGGRRPIDLFGRGYAHANRPQPLVVCQIESPEALENLDAIAGTDGVDALFFGADDLAMAMGMPMDQAFPAGCFDAEIEAVAEAAKRHGKIAGGVFGTPAAMQKAVAMGYRLVVGGGDVAFLAQSSSAAAAAHRAILAGNPA